jgi:hypothetical protein
MGRRRLRARRPKSFLTGRYVNIFSAPLNFSPLARTLSFSVILLVFELSLQ